jgi:hypothetical protein
MTDFRDPDPRMRDLDPRMRDYDDRYASESKPPWGWIAGAIFVFLVLAAVFSWGRSDKTAVTDIAPPPSTTGAAPPANPRPALPTAPPMAPAPPAGQGTAQ